MTTALNALAYLSRQEPTPDYFVAFQQEISAEKNDRGAACWLVMLRFAFDLRLVETLRRVSMLKGTFFTLVDPCVALKLRYGSATTWVYFASKQNTISIA
jgi:hypothetical protein